MPRGYPGTGKYRKVITRRRVRGGGLHTTIKLLHPLPYRLRLGHLHPVAEELFNAAMRQGYVSTRNAKRPNMRNLARDTRVPIRMLYYMWDGSGFSIDTAERIARTLGYELTLKKRRAWE